MSGGARRQLAFIDVLGIGINGIVGSGVYLLVAPMAARAGAASALGVLACGLLCGTIALCFAELSSMFDRSGGPTLYARAAFGPALGFANGWLGAATGILGLAAVAVGLAGTLARLWPALEALPGGRTAVAVGIIAALGALNLRGVKVGGRTSTVLSLVKLLPLALLALWGLRHLSPALLAAALRAPEAAPGAEAPGFLQAVAKSAFLAVFMTSGFDYAAVPAGEVKEPRRTVPLALLGALGVATLLYVSLQLVALATVPALRLVQPEGAPASAQPLIDAALVVFGPWGAPLLGAAAALSMLGYCAGAALVAPRYLVALAEEDVLPRALAQGSRHGTPWLAILLSTLAACGLAALLGYTSLVDASNVVILSGYTITALATAALRFKRPELPRAVRLPFGVAIPALAAVSALVLLVSAEPKLSEFAFTGQLLLLGGAAWGATALARRDARAPEA